MALQGKPFLRIAGVLKQLAPTFLEAFGGPAGAIVATIAKKAMGDPGMTDNALQDAITAATTTPDGLAKIKQIEADVLKAEQDYQIRFAELDVQDRISARDLAVHTTALPQMALSALFVIGYFIILWLFFSRPATGMPMSEAFTLMLGVLTAGVPQVMNYWLGSSSGSAAKNDALTAIAKRPA